MRVVLLPDALYDCRMTILIVSMLIATFIPVAVLLLIYKLDLYRTGQFKIVVLAFFYGVAIFLLASVINRATLRSGLVPYEVFLRFTAPIVEEVLKALLLIAIYRRPSYTYVVDGAIYGFAVGIGFAVVEDYQYILTRQYAALSLAASRVISTNLMHATTTAVVGSALGWARSKRLPGVLALLAGGWAVAMAFHMGFNNLVTRVSGGFLLLYAAGMGGVGAGLIALIIRLALRDAKTRIDSELRADTRISAQEADAVSQFADLRKVLKPVAETFGDEKLSLMLHFLKLEAQIGLKENAITKLQDEGMRRSLQAQVNELREEMEKTRREVGAYPMLYMRVVFPQEGSPIWSRLDSAIGEKAAVRPATGGMNLWSTLDQRTRQQSTGQSEDPG
jgi:RsiW-degrading membrane proteinase PrsW (M82 family)